MLIETVYMLAIVFYIFFWRVLVNLEHIQKKHRIYTNLSCLFFGEHLWSSQNQCTFKEQQTYCLASRKKHTFFFLYIQIKRPNNNNNNNNNNNAKQKEMSLCCCFSPVLFLLFPLSPGKKKHASSWGSMSTPMIFCLLGLWEPVCESSRHSWLQNPPIFEGKNLLFRSVFPASYASLTKVY